MNLFLYKELSQELLKILHTLQITYDEKTQLNQNDFFYILIDYNSSDKIAKCIDNVEDKHQSMSSIKIIYKKKIPLQKLLGEKLYKDLRFKKDRDFQLYYFGKKTFLTNSEYKKIFQIQKPAFESLCQKYFISSSSNAYDMFISLLSLGIYFLSGLTFIKTKPISSKPKLHVPNSVQQFSFYIMKHKKVVVSGLHGAGKTTLLSSFLDEYKIDYIYLKYTDSLKKTFEQKMFSEATDFKKNLSLLKEKGSYSFLIIDDMNPEKSVFIEETEMLASLQMHVILVTTHAIYLPGFQRYSTPLFTKEELCSIIPGNIVNEISGENLLEFTSKNPYLLSLIAFTGTKNPDVLPTLLKGSIETPSSVSLPLFKHPYHQTKTNFWGHATKVYDLYYNKKDYQLHRNHLKILACFFDHSIPIDFLKHIFSEYSQDVVLELIDMGYVECVKNSNKTIRLSPAMANIIFIHEKPSYSDNLLSQVIMNITNYLESYDTTLDPALLENILYPFAVRLGPTISQKNNPGQKNVSQNQENWWSFLYLTIEYYQMLNKPDTALALIRLLIYPEELQYRKSPYDASLLKIFTSWINGKTDYKSGIDSLCSMISDPLKFPPTEVPKINTMLRYFVRNHLDFLIYQQLQDPFTLGGKTYSEATDLFLKCREFIYYLVCTTTDSINKEYYNYYVHMFLLIFKDTYLESWEFLTEHFKIVCTYQKKVQKICCICAFIYVCLKKILNEAPESHFEILTTALSKLESEIDSVCMLPGLLGQMCLVTCTNCHILMQIYDYPSINLPDEILISIKKKYSTIRSEEWSLWQKVLSDLI